MATSGTRKVSRSSSSAPAAGKVRLLAGDNPQIAKGEGEGPVRAYLDAIPGWKQARARQLDALITAHVPKVRKAVKWNSPWYGVEGQGWFLSFHCISKYLKVAFFKGTSLDPLPPVESKQQEVRYLHVFEDEPLDEAQFVAWVKQAGALPGHE